MQPVATIETVARACEQLKRDGQKITGRAVLAITGGSLGTVLTLIKEWRKFGQQALAPLPEEMPSDLQAAILRALGQAQAQAAEELKIEVAASKDREAEVLGLYSDAETTINQLTAELKSSQGRILTLEQEAEKTAGITIEKLDALAKRVGELETERLQLIETGEAARIEAAKNQVKIERADQATEKYEKKVKILEQTLAQSEAGRIAAEKAVAVANQKMIDQDKQLKNAQLLIEQAEGNVAKSADQIQELKQVLAQAEVGRTAAEKRAALAEQKTDSQTETIAELRSTIAELKAGTSRQPKHE